MGFREVFRGIGTWPRNSEAEMDSLPVLGVQGKVLTLSDHSNSRNIYIIPSLYPSVRLISHRALVLRLSIQFNIGFFFNTLYLIRIIIT